MEWDIKEHNCDGINLTTMRATGLSSVSAIVQIGAGALQEHPHHKRGSFHLFEHVPLEGTLHFPGPIHPHADEINAYVGAGTSYESTNFEMTTPLPNWRSGLNLLTDIVLNPTLNAQVVIDECRTIANEVRELPFSFPLESVHIRKAKALVGNDPRIEAILGTREDILSIRREDLLQIRDAFYVRENCRIVVKGDLPHDEMRSVVSEMFSPMPHGKPAQKVRLSFCSGYNLLPMPFFENVKNHIAFPMESGIYEPQVNALLWILGRYFTYPSSPVMQDMRDHHKLVYGTYESSRQTPSLGYFEIGYISAPEEAEAYTSKMIQHLINLTQGTAGKKLFDTVKAAAVRDHMATASTKKHPLLEGVLNMYNICGRLVSPEEEIESLKKLTYGNLVDFARKTFSGAPAFFAFGTTDGIFPEQRFWDMVEPLTACASSYCREAKVNTLQM
ncbi:MAG: insulinase family protein [Alphaproteobacteria bacterium]|nr:insulinase family protein [Alphaproteobacteria bacterium]